MDTIETTLASAAKSRELDFAKRQLLQDLADTMNRFRAARSLENHDGMAYCRGKYYGLLAGLLYTGMVSSDEHADLSKLMIRAIEGRDGYGHL